MLGPKPAGAATDGSARMPAPTVEPVMRATAPSTLPGTSSTDSSACGCAAAGCCACCTVTLSTHASTPGFAISCTASAAEAAAEEALLSSGSRPCWRRRRHRVTALFATMPRLGDMVGFRAPSSSCLSAVTTLSSACWPALQRSLRPCVRGRSACSGCWTATPGLLCTGRLPFADVDG